MNVWYKPRLQGADNIIKTQVLGGKVSRKQIDAESGSVVVMI